MPLKILQQEKEWAAIYKPKNTHSDEITLDCDALGAFKAVHRLDFETQGLLLLAAEQHWANFNSLFVNSGAARKIYLAGAENSKAPTGPVRGWVGSRYRSSKKTRFTYSEEELDGYRSVQEASHIVRPSTLKCDAFAGNIFEVELITGRRHQIRSFFATAKNPLIGDALYGSTHTNHSLELVSYQLEFINPIDQKKIALSIHLSDIQF